MTYIKNVKIFFQLFKILRFISLPLHKHLQSYRLVTPIDPHQEQGLGDEQADAKVLVNGVAITLQPAKEAEGEEADEQADQ